MRAPLLSGSFLVPSRQLMLRTISQPLPIATLARSTVSAAAPAVSKTAGLLGASALVLACDREDMARSKIGRGGGGSCAVSL